MKPTKCITFDQEAQDALPDHIKAKMKTIERFVTEKYLEQKELPAHKQIPAQNFIDWAQFGAREAQRWISVDKELPKDGIPCIVKNQAGNMCICFMKYQTMVNGEHKPLGWYNYWYGRSETRTNGPIRATITHWKYVDRY